MKYLYLTTLITLLVSCQTKKSDSQPLLTPPPTLTHCHTLETNKQYHQAMKKYTELLAMPDIDQATYQAAILGKSRAFLGLKQYTYAIAALAPMPEKVDTYFKRQKLAQAGAILLTKQKNQSAESILELAIHQLNPNHDPQFAPVFANLATAYLRNYKVKQGIRLMQKATTAFTKAGNPTQARSCQRTITQIKEALQK